MRIQKNFVLLFLEGIFFFAKCMALFAQSPNEDALIFTFEYVDSKKYTIDSLNYQTITDNGVVVSKDTKLKNHISLEVQRSLNDTFYIFQNTEFTENGHLRYEEKSEYYQTRQGLMTVSPKYTTPLVRNIPRFQTRAIRVNEQWYSRGIDSIQVPIVNTLQKIPVDVSYVYTGTRNIPKSFYDNFIADDENRNTSVTFTKKYPAFTARYAIKNYRFVDVVQKDTWNIEGSFVVTIWWHSEYGRPVFSHEKYNMQITNEVSARVFTFAGTSFARVKAVVEINRENEIEAIQEDLKNTSLNDVEVVSNQKGITIRLPHLRFLPDSAELLKDEEQKLDVISNILKKYPKRRVLIEGHTAFAGTKSSRKRLSVKRAKHIKDILQMQIADGRDILFRGWGAEKPLVPNTSEENKRKNRRVEITILEN